MQKLNCNQRLQKGFNDTHVQLAKTACLEPCVHLQNADVYLNKLATLSANSCLAETDYTEHCFYTFDKNTL